MQANDYPQQRRYRIVLRSTMGPIDVYLVRYMSVIRRLWHPNYNVEIQLNVNTNYHNLSFQSQFEEMSGMETPPRPAQTISMDSLENPRTPLPAGSNKDVEMELNIQEGLVMHPDAPTSSQEIGGMMKIVPSELDVSSLVHNVRII